MFNLEFIKKTCQLAWPISLQSVLVTLLGMIDIIMVSHLGDSAVASVGISNRVFFVVLIIVTGVATGVGVLSAQYYGAGKVKKIQNIVMMAIIFSFAVLLPIVILNIFYADNVLELASQDSLVIATGEAYLWITVPSLFFIAVIIIFENALRATGQVKLPMLFSILAIVVNVILNYWLINGGLGVDAMGVVGAAWATTISRLFHLVIMLMSLRKSAQAIFPTRDSFSELTDKIKWLKFTNLIWPMMVSFGVWSLGTFVYQLIFGRMGTQELAVMSMLTPIEGVLIASFFGFSSACSILVGQQLGKSDYTGAWNTGKFFSFSAPVVTFVLAIILLIFEDAIFLPFQSLADNTLELASEVFVLIIFGTCIKVLNMTISMGVLRAGGDNKYCLVIDSVGMWFISIPLTFTAAFYFQWPLFWVVVTAFSEEICKVLMFVLRMRKKVWLRNLTT